MRIANDFHQPIELESGVILPANSVTEVPGLHEKDRRRHMSGKGKHARRRLRIIPDAPVTNAPIVMGAATAAGPASDVTGSGASASGTAEQDTKKK